jgi:uncharacterized membrane protein YphA (DoxX/SURF4 family)
MVGTLPWAWARAIGRAHLIALWCWAGLNKLLSPDFLGAAGSGRWMARGLMDHPPGVLLDHFGYAVALTELATGVLAIVPRTRRAAAVLALALHGGILYVLSPLRHDWNEAIWPWNVALAVAGFAFFWAWRERPLRALRGLPAPALALALAILVSPALWYVGRWDAYLSHHLYSDSAPVSLRCDAAGRCQSSVEAEQAMKAFNVPVPPEPRLFRAYFNRTCAPGGLLEIRERARWAQTRGAALRVVRCHGNVSPG